jgi:hypothetical protein
MTNGVDEEAPESDMGLIPVYASPATRDEPSLEMRVSELGSVQKPYRHFVAVIR